MSDEMYFDAEKCKRWEEGIKEINEHAKEVTKKLNQTVSDIKGETGGALGEVFYAAAADVLPKFNGLAEAVNTLYDVIKDVRNMWFKLFEQAEKGVADAVKRMN